MTKKWLSYEEVIAIAKENYYKGGDAIVECLAESDYEYMIREFGHGYTKTGLKNQFRDRREQLSEWKNMAEW